MIRTFLVEVLTFCFRTMPRWTAGLRDRDDYVSPSCVQQIRIAEGKH
jgi:hypothetical protein